METRCAHKQRKAKRGAIERASRCDLLHQCCHSHATQPLIAVFSLVHCLFCQGCDGGDPAVAYVYVQKNGLEDDGTYPYLSGDSGINGLCSTRIFLWLGAATSCTKQLFSLPLSILLLVLCAAAGTCEYKLSQVTARIANFSYATPPWSEAKHIGCLSEISCSPSSSCSLRAFSGLAASLFDCDTCPLNSSSGPCDATDDVLLATNLAANGPAGIIVDASNWQDYTERKINSTTAL